MRSVRLLAFAALLAVVCCIATDVDAQPKQQDQIRVLLIAGDDVAPYHDWREISEKTREVLVSSPRFDVKVCEEPLILESNTAIGRYDVILLTMYNRAMPTITGQAKENLLEFVKKGKGFYVQHLASASFSEWDEFGKLCGRKWVMGTSGHGPRGVFGAKIVKEHPITRGLKDFKIFDELYAKLQGDSPIEVLVSADSDWSKNTEPLVFTRSYGKGRCVHNAFGHDHKAILDPNMKQLIRNGVEWAATGKVRD
ncbi:MAG: ThuA domain-containing protein [Planctomycetes bacterium]|nr:ThuA domain-containing protein [Planctomycetota bacterium]